jgi:hypothetical protein
VNVIHHWSSLCLERFAAHFSDNSATLHDLLPLAGCPNLRSLSIHGLESEFGTIDLEPLTHFTCLTELSIENSDMYRVPIEVLASSLTVLIHLRSLTLELCTVYGVSRCLPDYRPLSSLTQLTSLCCSTMMDPIPVLPVPLLLPAMPATCVVSLCAIRQDVPQYIGTLELF